MEIFVCNLPSSVYSCRLKALFSKFGRVVSVKVIFNHYTRVSKGYGFVVMQNENEAKIAIQALNGIEIETKVISVRASNKKKRLIKGTKTKKKNKTKIDEYCASTIDFQKISNFWPVRNRMTRK